ncbi:MAG TPA: MFS transporter [Cytophagales bacterium]|nr:MFS transporter [Cytophagales bacterium]HAA23334.1 MFS transporter [Cytophagales bacterium]HAP65005.1 MFS transporter [Cytophagales bacterium]
MSRSKSPLLPILLVNFIGTLGYSFIVPYLVYLVTAFGGNEVIYGLMGAVYPALQLIGAPLLGAWSDRYGRKRILVISQAGTFLAWVLFLVALLLPVRELLAVQNPILGSFFFSLPLILLFMARALDGITGGNVSVANAYLEDISNEGNRKANFGKMSASANLGFILGPALAGVLGGTIMGEKLPVLVAMAVSLVAIFVIAYGLPESNPGEKIKLHLPKLRTRHAFDPEHKDCKPPTPKPTRKTLKFVWKLPGIARALTLYFLIFLGFNFFYTSFPIHAKEALQWDLTTLGIFYTVMSGSMVIVQGPILSWLNQRVREETLLVVGNLILAGSFVLLTIYNDTIAYIAAILFAIGNGVMWPSFLSILARTAGKEHQGAVQGYATSAGSLASIIGLIAGGVIYGQIKEGTFWIAAIIIFMVCLVSISQLKAKKTPTGP